MNAVWIPAAVYPCAGRDRNDKSGMDSCLRRNDNKKSRNDIKNRKDGNKCRDDINYFVTLLP